MTTEVRETRGGDAERVMLLEETGGKVRGEVWAGLAICLLLAVVQVVVAGYQMGMGNQGIQIAFLRHWANPALYADDVMVTETLPAYPSYFFRVLAPLLAVVDVGTLYVGLHLLTSFATLAAMYGLGRSIFKSQAAGLMGAALLVTGRLEALAGEVLYSQAFTHTYLALPVAVACLALAYRRQWAWAFVWAGVLFNLHALTAAYVMLMMGAGMLADIRVMKFGEWVGRAILCGALAFALASPTLAVMARQHQVFDSDWVNLMRIRSADHSFASTWWRNSDGDIPRFVLMLALFGLAWSFGGKEQGEEGRITRRVTALMTAAIVGLFAVGYVFSDVHPVPLMIRLQPFRASRVLMMVMVAYIANGAVAAIGMGLKGVVTRASGEVVRMGKGVRVVEILVGVLVVLTVGVPVFLPMLPVTVACAVVAALLVGRVSWKQAVVVAGALVVAILAHVQIQYPLVAVDLGMRWKGGMAAAGIGWAAAVGCAGLVMMLAFLQNRVMRGMLIGVGMVLAVALAGILFVQEKRAVGGEIAGDRMGDVAAWARGQTPLNTLFLTPAGLGNFRIAAERALVGDWRDGTQLYFSSSFGPEWFERVTQLKPGLKVSEDGGRLISPGEDLGTLDDKALVDLAQAYEADYIVVPNAEPGHPRAMPVAFAGERYTVFEPRIDYGNVPKDVVNVALWKAGEEFMANTVKPNIEKNRKADVRVEVVDGSGRPVQDLGIKLDQTKLAFVFGASLGFFEPNTITTLGDPKPLVVTANELEKMPTLFNGSMIPFSSKWAFIEPKKGEYHWSDLDKYVDFCVKNDVTMEFHHLTGTLPPWVLGMGGVAGQRGLSFPVAKPEMQAEFNRHCLDTVERYADRIKYFQVVNEKFMMQYVPEAMKLLKAKYPKTQFGISDCVKFWDSGVGAVASEQYRGADAIEWLKEKGVTPDFFSVHGHHPAGLWADPKEMYNVIDYFATRGLRVHLSEEYLQVGGPVYGPMRGGTWTAELEADYLVRYLTVAFSHPDVDMVNMWGLSATGWGASSGLLDAQGKPKPAWDALKKLFTETWRSHEKGVLGLDGAYKARVFQGTYQVTVTLANGKQAVATVVVPEKSSAVVKLKLEGEKLDVRE